jgi:hypothetical protein
LQWHFKIVSAGHRHKKDVKFKAIYQIAMCRLSKEIGESLFQDLKALKNILPLVE